MLCTLQIELTPSIQLNHWIETIDIDRKNLSEFACSFLENTPTLAFPYNCIDCSGKPSDISLIESGNIDSTTVGEVDMMLMTKLPDLLLAEIHVGEQTSLYQDMIPVTGCLEFFFE